MSAPAKARRGRPRSEAIDSAILDATVDELIERGFLGLSMEAIATRAGVAKTTLYRRWPNTTELALEAMRTFERVADDPPPGSVRDQILWLLDEMRRKWNDPRYAAVMRRVVADGNAQPELYRQTRDRLIGHHLRRMNLVIGRGVATGVIRPGLDATWVRQLLSSPILAASLTLKDRISKAQMEASVDIVLRGLAP